MKSKKRKLSTVEKCDIFVSELTKKLILFIMIAIPVIQLIRIYSMVNSVKTGHMFLYDNLNVSYIVYITLPILLGIYIYKLVRKQYKIGIKDYILYFLSVLAVVSTLGAKDVHTSIFGLGDRFEGLFAVVFYYLLILVSASVEEWNFKKMVINVFIGIGLLQVIYAFLQTIIRPWWALGFVLPYMANGLSGNPNFLGNFMAMCLMLAIGSYLFMPNHKKFYFVCSILFGLGVVLANSFGPLTGILISSLILIGIIIKKYRKLLKKCILILAVSALTIVIGAYVVDDYCVSKFNDDTMPGYTLRNDFDEILGVIFNKSEKVEMPDIQVVEEKGSNPISMVNGRSEVWKKSWEMAKDNLLFGVGLDNFAGEYQQRYGVYIDKAHNIYLNILITNGIFAMIGYIGFMVYVFVNSLKKLDDLSLIILLVFVCYIVQAFFSINVLVVVPYFYIITGLLLQTSQIDHKKSIKK